MPLRLLELFLNVLRGSLQTLVTVSLLLLTGLKLSSRRCYHRAQRLLAIRPGFSCVFSAAMLLEAFCAISNVSKKFSLGWWVFLDGLTLAVTHAGQGCGDRPNHLPTDPCFVPPVRFEDWVPGIIASLSLIMCALPLMSTERALSFFLIQKQSQSR